VERGKNERDEERVGRERGKLRQKRRKERVVGVSSFSMPQVGVSGTCTVRFLHLLQNIRKTLRGGLASRKYGIHIVKIC